MEFFIGVMLILGYVWHHRHKGYKLSRKMWVHVDEKKTYPPSGWIYFACGSGTPVLVGSSKEEPSAGNVPELKNAAVPMRVVYKFRTDNLMAAAERIVGELKPYHVRQGWFDRDATLFYVDHLKGAV